MKIYRVETEEGDSCSDFYADEKQAVMKLMKIRNEFVSFHIKQKEQPVSQIVQDSLKIFDIREYKVC